MGQKNVLNDSSLSLGYLIYFHNINLESGIVIFTLCIGKMKAAAEGFVF
jgi:hypothetical protein